MLLWFLFIAQNSRHRASTENVRSHSLPRKYIYSYFGVSQIVLSDHALLKMQDKSYDCVSSCIFHFPCAKLYVPRPKEKEKAFPFPSLDAPDVTSLKLA